jgi:very-short-patch-repair endonuclease
MGKCEYKYREILCVSCGKTVGGHFNKNQKYCSRKCYDTYRPTRTFRYIIEKQCEICSNHFTTKTQSKRFCGNTCQIIWQSRNKSRFICKTCGTEFAISKSLADGRKYETKFCSIVCRNSDDEWRQSNIKANQSQQNRKGLNGLEIAGNFILNDIGVEYECQQLLFDKFLVDVVLVDKKIVIQWDGDYWHGHPTKLKGGIPDHRQLKRMNLDKSQDAYMRKAGYTVLRFWESDIKLNKDYIYETIKAAIR